VVDLGDQVITRANMGSAYAGVKNGDFVVTATHEARKEVATPAQGGRGRARRDQR
jgi:hypothetical protein